jgi:hypothetical protein
VHGLAPGLLCGSFGLLQEGAQFGCLGFRPIPALLGRHRLGLDRDDPAAFGLHQQIEPVGTVVAASWSRGAETASSSAANPRASKPVSMGPAI